MKYVYDQERFDGNNHYFNQTKIGNKAQPFYGHLNIIDTPGFNDYSQGTDDDAEGNRDDMTMKKLKDGYNNIISKYGKMSSFVITVRAEGKRGNARSIAQS